MTTYALTGAPTGQSKTVAPGDTGVLSGSIINQGTIDDIGGIYSYGPGPSYAYGNASIGISGAVQLSGGGTLTLGEVATPSGDPVYGTITSDSTTSSLDNVDNTINGSGLISQNAGGGQSLIVTNEAAGTINGNGGVYSLTIQVRVVNKGLVEGTGTAGLLLQTMTLDQTGGGTLGAFGAGSVVNLDGATILGGVLTTTGGGVIDAVNSHNNTNTLVGSTITTGSKVQVLDNLHLQATITDAGTIAVAGNDVLIIDNAVTLTGGGAIALSTTSAGSSAITAYGPATLDNVNDTISGSGVVTAAFGNGGVLTLTNEVGGTIDATDAVNTLTITGDKVINNGLLEGTAAGGLYLQTLTVDQTGGGTLKAAGQGALVYLDGANILGGSLITAAGGLIEAINTHNNTNTLVGSTITAGSTVKVLDNLHLQGAITDAGTIAVAGNDVLVVDNAVTLTGGGAIAMSTTSAGSSAIIAYGPVTLDNVNDTISGSGVVTAAFGNGGFITLTNEVGGIIDATDAVNTLTITGDKVINNGLLEGTAAGGLYLQTLTVDQTGGGTLKAAGQGALVYLDGANILGGTLTTSGGGAIEAINSHNNTNTLTGSTITAGSTVQVSDNLHLQAMATILGTIALAPQNGSVTLIIDGAATLMGGGAVVLKQVTAGTNTYTSTIAAGANSPVLDNFNDTISGTGTINFSFINEAAGVVDATDPVNALSLVTGTITNTGLLESVAAGSLYLHSETLNQSGAGRLVAAGGVVTLDGTTINGGVFSTTGGGVINAINSYNNSNTLIGVTISAGTLLQVMPSTLYLEGSLANQGTVALIGNATLNLYTPVTLTGGGAIALITNSGGSSTINGNTLDNVNNIIYGSGTINASLINEAGGVIDASSATSSLSLVGTTVTNNGLLVAVAVGSLYMHSLVLNQSSTGTLVATGAGIVTLDGTTITGGTLTANNGGVINAINSYNNSNTLIGLAISAGTLLQVMPSTLYLEGAIANQGTIALIGSATLNIDTPVTLTGGGAIALVANGSVTGTINGTTLDNVNNVIYGTGTVSALLTNEAAGIIDASNATSGLSLVSTTVTNNGLIVAVAAGGLYTHSLTLNQSSTGTLLATGSGIVTLDGTTVTGGTLTAANGGMIDAINSYNNSNTLIGLAISAGSMVQVMGSTLFLEGAIANQGVIALAANGTLNAYTPVTLSGGGAITLVATSTINGSTFDNVNETISGSGTINDQFTNEAAGIVAGTSSTNSLSLVGSTITNNGLIEAIASGSVYGHALTLNQSATGTLFATSSGVVTLDGTVITGGSLSTATGGVINAINSYNNSNTLIGLAISVGTLLQVMPSTLNLEGAIANKGTVALIGNATLNIYTPVTLTGGGAITLSTNSGGGSIINGNTLDNVSNTISGSGTIQLSLTNEAGGTIDATSAANALVLYGNSLANKGLVESTGGATLTVQSVVLTQSGGGTLDAVGMGSIVQLSNATVTGGTLGTSGGGVIETTGSVALNGTAAIVGGSFLVGGSSTVTAGPSVMLGGDLDVEGALNTDASGLANQSVGSLTGAGAILVGNSGSTAVNAILTVGSDGKSTTFSGSLNTASGVTLSLVKAGTGTLTLSGSSNRYSGGTTILGGTLDLATQGAVGAGAITFGSSAATLDLEAGALPQGGTFFNTIAGFAGGDTIEVSGTVTAATYNANSSGPGGTLTLTNGAVKVGTLFLTSGVPQDYLRITNSGGHASITRILTPSDFNGDGDSDILLQNTNGNIVTYTQSNLAITAGAFVGNPGVTWHVVGSADFNGDGQTDILLQNNNGGFLDYLMNGSTIASGYYLGDAGQSWHVRGIGDFNGDGKADIVIQNDNSNIVVYDTNGTGLTTGTYVGTPGAGWTVEGVADFNGDGKPDILVQNVNGAIVDYTMNGATIASAAYLGNPGAGWSVAGTGNYNGSSQAGILLHNDNGANEVWNTDGSTVTSVASLGNPGASYGTAVGGMDLNGDGTTDLVVQNTSSILVGYTLSNTAQITAGAVLGTPGAGWNAIGNDPVQYIDGTQLAAGATAAATIGVDQFDFTSAMAGAHNISGFDAAQDSVALGLGQFANYAAVQANEFAFQGGTFIPLATGSALVIQGVTPGQLSASNFVLR